MQATTTPSPVGRERRWYPRRVIAATLVVVLVATGFYLLYVFSNVLFVLFVAAVLATALRPAVLWLERHGVAPSLGTLLVFVLIGGFTVGVLTIMAPLLLNQITALATELPQYYSSFREWLASTTIPIARSFARQLPADFPLMGQSAPPTNGEEQINAAAQVIAYVRAAGWTTFGGIAISLITYFWIVDREQIVRAGLLLIPLDQRDNAHAIWDTLEDKVGAFVRGQALLCLSIGVLSAIAFFAIGVPNALLLAVLAGILEAVPFVGPIATAALAISLTLAQAPEKIWWVLGASVLIQQIENAVLVPRIMDRAVGVNAVVTLLSIAAFGTLLGVGGAIMAIPLAVIIQVLVDRLLFSTPPEPAVEIVGRDHVAVLRYEAQDLASDLREWIKAHADDESTGIMEEDLEAVVGEIDDLLQTLHLPPGDRPQGQPAQGMA